MGKINFKILLALIINFHSLSIFSQEVVTKEVRDIEFMSKNPQQLEELFDKKWRPIAVKAKLFIPMNPVLPKAPAMVILHGSAGISEGRENEYGAKFNKVGIYALVVDTYGTRGANQLPYNRRIVEVSAFTQTADGIGALNYLESQSEIDSSKIGVIGFSLGGMSTYMLGMENIVERLTDNPLRFSANINLYGPCFSIFRTVKPTPAPFLFIGGEKDEALNLDDCRKGFSQLEKKDKDSKFVVIPNAYHGWERNVPLAFTNVTNLRNCNSIIEDDGKTFFVKTGKLVRGNRDKFSEFFKCASNGYTNGKDPVAEKIADKEILNFIANVFKLN
jgi:dienelactone hydrolase